MILGRGHSVPFLFRFKFLLNDFMKTTTNKKQMSNDSENVTSSLPVIPSENQSLKPSGVTEKDWLVQNHAQLQRIRRIIQARNLVLMQQSADGEYYGIERITLDKGVFHAYRDANDSSSNPITGNHVLVDDKKIWLNSRMMKNLHDPGERLFNIATGLNSMMIESTQSIFIASPNESSDEFFLVRKFLTDGDCLYAIADGDGHCYDLTNGWVFELKRRWRIYGQGGPSESNTPEQSNSKQ
jgi:hypothetical protein